ncbi:MAG: class I SAM-dependent methyltransferase [Bacteroidales bacterium]|nr:class I SAM-dependent methyltransferase [Bacteroidales bacterium]
MEFDSKAKTWDKDPVKIERAKTYADEIIASLPDFSDGIAMEFGCGTGQVSLFLSGHFKTIYMVDSSAGMIDVLRENIKEKGMKNMIPVHKDVLKDGIELPRLDVIYTLMTLHHIEDLDGILHIFNRLLKPGGLLFIGDLEKEDGSFHDHSHDFKGHHGFERERLKLKLEDKGFRETDYRRFFKLTKKFEDGSSKEFPLFFMAARKY